MGVFCRLLFGSALALRFARHGWEMYRMMAKEEMRVYGKLMLGNISIGKQSQ